MKRAGWLLACCLAGCLGGKRPQYDYFVLTPASQLASSTTQTDGPTLGVSQVTIPGYLDRESIVLRTDDNRLVYSAHDRWAEPLDAAFERTLRQELGAKLARDGITVPARTGAPTYDVQVDILRFERHGDQVELWARWTLRAQTRVVHSGETRIRAAAAPGNGAAAAALSVAVARLAGDIAGEVQIASATVHEPHEQSASAEKPHTP